MVKNDLMILWVLFFIASSLLIETNAATGFEYFPDEHTIGLWHFNEGQGNIVKDASKNNIKAQIEGKAKWDKDDWNKEGGGHSFVFEGKTALFIPVKDKVGNKLLTPNDAITVEAWVYATGLTAWNLIGTHWAAAVGKYHLGVNNGVPKMHVNTKKGVKNATGAAIGPKKWYHIAGSYDGQAVKIYIDGKLSESVKHGGELATGSPWDVMIGAKHSREFHWAGLMDEIRFSSIAREPEELSPNFDAPQSVNYNSTKLPVFWANLKK